MLRTRIVASRDNVDPVHVSLYLKYYDEHDELTILPSEPQRLAAGDAASITWQVPDTNNYPIAFVGIQVTSVGGNQGTIYLNYLTWDGAPHVTLNRPWEREQNRLVRQNGPIMWKKAWVDGFDSSERLIDHDDWPVPYRLIQNNGSGLLIQGTRDWQDYRRVTSNSSSTTLWT